MSLQNLVDKNTGEPCPGYPESFEEDAANRCVWCWFCNSVVGSIGSSCRVLPEVARGAR